MPKISEKGELTTKYTNHSLRATSASRMFASNVPEKVIQEKTGHGSLAGLRAYKHATTRQEQVVAKYWSLVSLLFLKNVARKIVIHKLMNRYLLFLQVQALLLLLQAFLLLLFHPICSQDSCRIVFSIFMPSKMAVLVFVYYEFD